MSAGRLARLAGEFNAHFAKFHALLFQHGHDAQGHPRKVGEGSGQSGKAQGARAGGSTAQCIDKLVTGGQITRKVADEALEFFRRSKAEYSREMGPASANAAAALETAKRMHDTARANQEGVWCGSLVHPVALLVRPLITG
jgi:hypothetical protein